MTAQSWLLHARSIIYQGIYYRISIVLYNPFFYSRNYSSCNYSIICLYFLNINMYIMFEFLYLVPFNFDNCHLLLCFTASRRHRYIFMQCSSNDNEIIGLVLFEFYCMNSHHKLHMVSFRNCACHHILYTCIKFTCM